MMSFSEIETTTKRASKAAGFSWGIAEEIGKSIRSLELFGLPGAFTPTCSTKHLPGFVMAIDQLKEKDIKKVICISVNDPFVMDAWGKTHNVQDKIIMLGDYKGDFTRNIGAEQNLSHRGLGIRSSRYTMLVEKGNVVKISEEEIAGKCEITAAENFLKEI